MCVRDRFAPRKTCNAISHVFVLLVCARRHLVYVGIAFDHGMSFADDVFDGLDMLRGNRFYQRQVMYSARLFSVR